MAGISQGARTDSQGISHIVTVDRPEGAASSLPMSGRRRAWLPPFEVVWRSEDDPQDLRAVDTSAWPWRRTRSRPCPTCCSSGPLPADSAIRTEDGAAGIFIEQAPLPSNAFRALAAQPGQRQRPPPALLTGYRPAQVEVQPTPLSALATILAWLQDGQINRSPLCRPHRSAFTDMFQPGPGHAGDWMAVTSTTSTVDPGWRAVAAPGVLTTPTATAPEAIFEQNAESGRYVLQSVAGDPGQQRRPGDAPRRRPTSTPTAAAAAGRSRRFHAHRAALRCGRGPDAAGILNPDARTDGHGLRLPFTPTPTDTPTVTPTPSGDAAAHRHADAHAHGHGDAHGYATEKPLPSRPSCLKQPRR